MHWKKKMNSAEKLAHSSRKIAKSASRIGHPLLQSLSSKQPPLPSNPPPPPLPPNSPPPDPVLSIKSEFKDQATQFEVKTDDNNLNSSTTQNKTTGEIVNEKIMCRQFARNNCTRGESCIYVHEIIISQLKGVYTFCKDFANSASCHRPACKFVHASVFEREAYYRTGELPLECLEHLTESNTPLAPSGGNSSTYNPTSRPPPAPQVSTERLQYPRPMQGNLQHLTSEVSYHTTLRPPPAPQEFNNRPRYPRPMPGNLQLRTPSPEVSYHTTLRPPPAPQVFNNRPRYPRPMPGNMQLRTPSPEVSYPTNEYPYQGNQMLQALSSPHVPNPRHQYPLSGNAMPHPLPSPTNHYQLYQLSGTNADERGIPSFPRYVLHPRLQPPPPPPM